jgi:TRAP-type mannitol/chloroaromatic compound transport system permease small subunit
MNDWIKTLLFCVFFLPVVIYAHWDVFNHFGIHYWDMSYCFDKLVYAWKYIVYLLIIIVIYFRSLKG